MAPRAWSDNPHRSSSSSPFHLCLGRSAPEALPELADPGRLPSCLPRVDNTGGLTYQASRYGCEADQTKGIDGLADNIPKPKRVAQTRTSRGFFEIRHSDVMLF